MRRTQIYITEEQERRVAAIAADGGLSKAEVIRRILDAALGSGDSEAEARSIITATSGICSDYPDYPDWPEWQRAVRGRTAAERLEASGL